MASQLPEAMGGVESYKIVLICYGSDNATVTMGLLDEQHNDPEDFRQAPKDTNFYVWGRMAKHNVVLAQYGCLGWSTEALVEGLHSSLPHLRFDLSIGLGTAVNIDFWKIRLGDVVVGRARYGTPAALQYCVCTESPEQNDLCCAMSKFRKESPHVLNHALNYSDEKDWLCYWIEPSLQESNARMTDPSFMHEYPGDHLDPLRRGCEKVRSLPDVHYGLIASLSTFDEDAIDKDELIEQLRTGYGLPLCYEREAVGLLTVFPCVMVRGISNYAQTSNEVYIPQAKARWEKYATATAAAVGKQLLELVSPEEIDGATQIGGMWQESLWDDLCVGWFETLWDLVPEPNTEPSTEPTTVPTTQPNTITLPFRGAQR